VQRLDVFMQNAAMTQDHDAPAPNSQENLLRTFRHWDIQGNRLINREEFEAALGRMGVSEAERSRQFALADLNKDGHVDYQEFALWIYGPCPEELRDRALDAEPQPDTVDAENVPFMQMWLGSFNPAPKASLVVAAVGLLQKLNISRPEDLARYDTNDVRLACADLKLATFVLQAQRFMRHLLKEATPDDAEEAADLSPALTGLSFAESYPAPPEPAAVQSSSDWQAGPDTCSDSGLEGPPWEASPPALAPKISPATRMDLLLEALLGRLSNDGVVAPDNVKRIFACPNQHADCFVYRFGTKKVHVTERAGQPVVRAGGGFLSFMEFVQRHGVTEQAKLEKARRKAGQEPPKMTVSILVGGRISLRGCSK
jgi:hypothetical protein